MSKELDRDTPRTDCPLHLPAPPTDDEMREITMALLGQRRRHATHVSTGSGGPARDPTAPGELSERQRRRIDGLATAHGWAPPNVERMTHADADAWIRGADAAWRERATSRDEL